MKDPKGWRTGWFSRLNGNSMGARSLQTGKRRRHHLPSGTLQVMRCMSAYLKTRCVSRTLLGLSRSFCVLPAQPEPEIDDHTRPRRSLGARTRTRSAVPSIAADFKNIPLPPSELIAPGTAVMVAARTSFLEGPAVDASGDLYFSDMIGNRIYKMTPDGALSVFRADSGRTNGNTFDAQGRLISCEGAEQGPGGRRRVVRTDLKTGIVEVLTDRFLGKRYNSPNDVIVDAIGRVWFTDPYYGEDRASLELDAEAVYRIETDGKVTRVVSQPQIERPNGLAVSPDMKTLYLIDSNSRPGGNRKIWAFDLSADGTPSNQRLVYDFGRAVAATACGSTPGKSLGRRRHCPPAHRGRNC